MMIILAPDIPEEELDPSIDTIESYITNLDGSVVIISRESPWGRRRLAYPIRHQGRDLRDGFYTLWYFDADPTSITAIERELRLNDRIIRHMIIALDQQVTVIPAEPQTEAAGDSETAAAATVAPEAAPAAEADAAPGGEAETATAAEAEAPAAEDAPAEPEAETAAASEVTPAETESSDETTEE
jgi:small subunit ribosomal protein S6